MTEATQTFEHSGQTFAVGESNANGHVMGDGGHFLTPCDGCGATDDHPKHHVGQSTFHHDCLPAFVEQEVTRLRDTDPIHARNAEIVETARSGTRGSALRSYIAATHDEFAATLNHEPGPTLAEIDAMHAANVAAGNDPLAAPTTTE